MTSLASLSDLGDRIGQTLTGNTRAQKILDDVSARVRRVTGRTFTSATETSVVSICCGTATLPKGPVISITSVKVDGGDVDYTWTSGRSIEIPGYLRATVVYVAGYAAVPADIVAVVCQIAGRAYGTNSTESGTTEQHLGDYGTTTGGAAASGPLGILSDEREVLDSYRVSRVGTVRAGSWAW